MHRTTAIAVLLATVISTSSTQAQTPEKITPQEFEQMVKELSNWGRWGKDDQLGTLNLITPEKRKQALELVTEGIAVSLAHNVEKEETIDNPRPFEHTMIASGENPFNGQWAMDNFSVAYHGYAHTHMDSLCHLFYKDKMYNGFTKDDVRPNGADKLGIENIKQGIMSRGILIDIPVLRGVRFLEPGSPILPEELEAWEKRTGIQVESGDIVFIRTGRWARRKLTGPWDPLTDGAAGLHASCGRWLKDRDIAMLGSDAASDVIPSGIDGVSHPIHILTLHAMGVHIFDNCDLEALSKTAQELNRWEFLLTASPLAVTGGTGSPLNPIATY